ncbi:PREDICTED: probable LRR receptor-like serine/threonine-protein kinase At1g51860 [Tarenaya hassleriana]|uniref:probable LRR receptor-like serine/threonine-protein kinase At1g51860 n=1 Tax=Tarenaya hassleriana TaxID=28532 RepID=UPI00053C1EEF|nr:PREDICTED: probable LRR receptor-like serine/threonine-protein kinase At1g51860 [Tarenaya hassleriana]
MAFSLCLVFLPLGILSASLLCLAQDQSGFISLDCGSPKETSYREKTTNISYISDANFIDTGIGRSIRAEYRTQFQQQTWYVRSFPQGTRSCYSLNLTAGDEYLIRASFLQGDYDNNTTPRFDLHLGPNLWTTVSITNSTTPSIFEMIHLLKSDHLHVCLVKTGASTPFISALELRKLKNTTYLTQSGSLQTFIRADVGSTSDLVLRYGIDVFDRIWTPFNFQNWTQISTNKTVSIDNDYQPPEITMRTASIPIDPMAPMNITLTGLNGTELFYVFMHIAEIQELGSNETREFTIEYNGRRLYGPFRPIALTTTSVFTPFSVGADANGQYLFTLRRTGNSTLPPLLNAMEVYLVNLLPQEGTGEQEVDAMVQTKLGYGLNKIDWQGDPCVPQDYRWDGVACSYSGNDPPIITSLNLSGNGLTGKILDSITGLANLETLDLSNNNLSGSVPGFLARMNTLKVINLSGNNLNGSIPASLLEKSQQGSITLSVEGNPGLCSSSSCTPKKKKNSAVVPVVASLVSIFVVVAGLVTFLILKKKKKNKPEFSAVSGTGTTPLHSSSLHSYESKNRRFTYSEVLKISNNFERILGRGGFGIVYYGILDNNPVAVKMLTGSSVQGYKQFKAEVELLLRVHHKNLTSLVGYCDENEKLSLIYEFMANGDLNEHLSGKRGPSILTWEGRLRIAAESAQGLEYLHSGCKPQIVHRDVKTTNILLNEKFEAKLADFGLSRSFPLGNETHVSTVVAGTPGYLDPEYYRTNWLTEKSDVFSFGVVLLEIITNRPVIDQSRERAHIGEWVGLMLTRGDINSIVDQKLQGDFDQNSIWKAVETAMACLNPSSARRPTMTQVVVELNGCLSMEMARNQGSRMTDSTNDSSIELTMNYTTELYPGAR